MPITNVVDQEWLNSNSQRKYPLAEDADGTDTSGTFRLPDSFLVGLYVAVPGAAEVSPQKFFLRAVTAHAAGFVVDVAYDDGTSSPPIAATAVVTRAAHAEYNEYRLIGRGDFADATGSVVVGPLDEILATGAGKYTFSPASGRLDPDCIRPQLRGIAGLYITSGQNTFGPFFDDIEIVAGANIQFDLIATGGGITQFRIDAIEGAGLTAPCVCTGAPALPPPIRSINGVLGDGNLNIDLLGEACVAVTTGDHEVALANTCASPCCGCPELEAVAAETRHVREQAASLKAWGAAFKAWADATTSTVLGTRLSDLPCT